MGGWCSLILDDGTGCVPPVADIPVLFLVCILAVILCSLVRKCCKAYCGFRRNIVVPRDIIVSDDSGSEPCTCPGPLSLEPCEGPVPCEETLRSIIVRDDRCSVPCELCDECEL